MIFTWLNLKVGNTKSLLKYFNQYIHGRLFWMLKSTVHPPIFPRKQDLNLVQESGNTYAFRDSWTCSATHSVSIYVHLTVCLAQGYRK